MRTKQQIKGCLEQKLIKTREASGRNYLHILKEHGTKIDVIEFLHRAKHNLPRVLAKI